MSGFSEADLDLEKLFLPAWAQDKPAQNRYEKYSGDEGEKPRHEKRRGGFSDNRAERRPRFPQKSGDKRDFRRGDRGDRGGQREPVRHEPPAPLPEISVGIIADEKGVEHIARQIKMTGRAYPLFQIADLVLQKPERYSVKLGVRKKADGAIAQPLFVSALDDSPWLSEDEAVAHLLKNHFATFYQAAIRTPTDPPKGTYTFVAQCGMSGAILGPPNYHDYQNQLRKLHAERFSRMPFEVFKARVKIVKDEAVVKKWIEDQSFKTEYACLNVPEPLKLSSMDEVEKHFRATHKDAVIKSVETVVIDGVKSRNLRSRDLQRLVRVEWEHQKHFPLQLATALSKQFAGHGLQFFKVNKTVVHVSVARPQYLDLMATPVSDNIKRIVEFINVHPRCTRRKLIEALVPAPAAPAVETAAPAAEGGAPKPAQQPEPTPEQTALIADLHWLIHQGHVLEFADARLETAKKPVPRPPKPETKRVAPPVAEASDSAAQPTGAATALNSVGEIKPGAESESAAEIDPVEKVKPAEESPADATASEPVHSDAPAPDAVPADPLPSENPSAEEVPS